MKIYLSSMKESIYKAIDAATEDRKLRQKLKLSVSNVLKKHLQASQTAIAVPLDVPVFMRDAEVMEAWQGYCDMRKKIRKPMTDRAAQMILNKCAELSKGDASTAALILMQSEMNSWQGVFPLKKTHEQGVNRQQEHRDSLTELVTGGRI